MTPLEGLKAWVREILSPNFRCPECHRKIADLADTGRYFVGDSLMCRLCYNIELRKK